MSTYIRVVGFGDEASKLVDYLRCNVKKGLLGEKTAYEQLDFKTVSDSEGRERIKECIALEDAAKNAEHKLMLLVTRVDDAVASSVIPIFYKCAKYMGWDLGVMMMRPEERLDNGLPEWTDLPEGLCDFFMVLSTDVHSQRSYNCIAGLIAALKSQNPTHLDYEDFAKTMFNEGEAKFKSCHVPYWESNPITEMKTCILQVQHDSDFTMSQMQQVVEAFPCNGDYIILSENILEEGSPALVNVWYK